MPASYKCIFYKYIYTHTQTKTHKNRNAYRYVINMKKEKMEKNINKNPEYIPAYFLLLKIDLNR